MIKFKYLTLLLVLGLYLINIANACTTAIVSGKATPDGRPILWKHRDSESFNNKIIHNLGSKFRYLGLINSQDTLQHVWAGANSVGFSIMNAASYNIVPNNDTSKIKDMEGYVMKLALGCCVTITDFENLLDTLPKPWGISANFGIIDAQGGAGYYEVNNFGYKFFDANDTAVAPNGYLIRTNFSVSGRENEGLGYTRFNTAQNILSEAFFQNALTVEFFLHKASLCLRHDLTKTDLYNEFNKETFQNRMYPFRDFIVRYYSSSTYIVQGVAKGESPLLTTSWVKLGFQPASVAIPIWVGDSNSIPSIITAPNQGNSLLCDITLRLKDECFPYIKWNEGENYILLEKLGNISGTGMIQLIVPFDKEIMAKADKIIAKWRRSQFNEFDASKFYLEIDDQVQFFYNQNFEIKL